MVVRFMPLPVNHKDLLMMRSMIGRWILKPSVTLTMKYPLSVKKRVGCR
jgi:hypothetical protein